MNKNSLILILLTLSFILLLYTISSFADELSLTTVFTPRCKGDNTSDWKTNDWCKDYYDISNLCPGEYGTGPSDEDRKGCANVVKDIKFGRWQVGTGEGEIRIVRANLCCKVGTCWDASKCVQDELTGGYTKVSGAVTATCPTGYTVTKCYQSGGGGCIQYAGCADDCGRILYANRDSFTEFSPSGDQCEYTFSFQHRSCGPVVAGDVFAVCQKE